MDTAAAEHYGISGLALMENAGAAVARHAFRVASHASRRPSVCVFAGRGNNGGDGFVAARHLGGFGASVRVFLLGEISQIAGDARANLDAMMKSGINAVSLSQENTWNAARESLEACDVVIDAVLGTGARGAPSSDAERAVLLMNESGVPIVAVDVPSGADALTGATPGACVRAHTTVTLALAKTGLLAYPAASYVGCLIVDGIGMPAALAESSEIKTRLTAPDEVRAALPVRRPDAHKGDFGRVCVVAGSPGMSGAASMAAMGALRAGAGLVHLIVPSDIGVEVSARHAEIMVHSAPDLSARTVLEMTEACDAVVVGPGLSTSGRTSTIVDALIAECRAPMVLDADALNVLTGRAEALQQAQAPVIITPHPGELGRLFGASADEINRDRLGWARRAASETGASVALKGARTVIADRSGEAYVNPTGNPGMATAGMGDVLSGVVASMCAQGLDTTAAGYCAAYIHGLAGDFVARERGGDGMIARDVLERLPEALGTVRTDTDKLWTMMPVRFSHMPEGW